MAVRGPHNILVLRSSYDSHGVQNRRGHTVYYRELYRRFILIYISCLLIIYHKEVEIPPYITALSV